MENHGISRVGDEPGGLSFRVAVPSRRGRGRFGAFGTDAKYVPINRHSTAISGLIVSVAAQGGFRLDEIPRSVTDSVVTAGFGGGDSVPHALNRKFADGP